MTDIKTIGVVGARTLVRVTHDNELAGRCDRVLRLHQSRLSEPRQTAARRQAYG